MGVSSVKASELLEDKFIYWKKNYEEEFLEAVGEINQGNCAEAYYLALNRIKFISVFNISKDRVVDFILTLYTNKDFCAG